MLRRSQTNTDLQGPVVWDFPGGESIHSELQAEKPLQPLTSPSLMASGIYVKRVSDKNIYIQKVIKTNTYFHECKFDKFHFLKFIV